MNDCQSLIWSMSIVLNCFTLKPIFPDYSPKKVEQNKGIYHNKIDVNVEIKRRYLRSIACFSLVYHALCCSILHKYFYFPFRLFFILSFMNFKSWRIILISLWMIRNTLFELCLFKLFYLEAHYSELQSQEFWTEKGTYNY